MSNGTGSYYERWGCFWPDMRTGSLLGTGSFGNVWELLDEEDVRHTEAVKEILVPPESMGGLREAKLQGLDIKGANIYFEAMKKRALEETAMMMKLLSCPNIVRISDYRVCELDGQNDNAVCVIFIRMERLQPLKERLITEGITVGEILNLGIDICTALEECSRYGIVHRDVKPENIFVYLAKIYSSWEILVQPSKHVQQAEKNCLALCLTLLLKYTTEANSHMPVIFMRWE